MKVYFDPQTFLRQRTGGISRLFADLIREFDEHPDLGVQSLLPFRLSNNAYAASDLAYRGMIVTPSWLPRGVLYAPWWARGSWTASKCDIVHHTYYSGRFLGAPRGTKQVTTVYDMIPELFAGTDSFTATHLEKRQYVETCELVICISESTRQDMVSVYGDIAQNVRVIPLAVRPGFGPHHEPMPDLPHEYLLYVGARKGYKDFPLLPEALELLRADGVDVPLVVVGKPFNPGEREDLEHRGLSPSVVNVQLSDDQLKRAYAHCAALVQTSRYEGFGLTPLEGMASGTAVVVANASSMSEVGGDVAQYFEPGDAMDLASVIAATLADQDLRRDLATRGLARAAMFTPWETAHRTAEAYASITV